MLRNTLIRLVSYISHVLGKISYPYLRKELDGEDYYEALKHIKEGMVLLTRSNGYLSNQIIPGFWSHAAIYVNPKSGRPSVIESTESGVTKTDLITFLMSKDVAMIVEPRFADTSVRAKAAFTASMLVGSPYDYSFQEKNDAFYCSELVWHSYDRAMAGKSPFQLRERYGYMTIAPDDFAEAKDKWSIVWQSKSYIKRLKEIK